MGVSQVRIRAIPSLNPPPLPAGTPRRVIKLTISDPARTKELALAICGLPDMPHGVIHCPADVGGGYELAFVADGQVLPTVHIESSGCEIVTGAGKTRWIGRTPSFWAVFARLTGIAAIAR